VTPFLGSPWAQRALTKTVWPTARATSRMIAEIAGGRKGLGGRSKTQGSLVVVRSRALSFPLMAAGRMARDINPRRDAKSISPASRPPPAPPARGGSPGVRIYQVSTGRHLGTVRACSHRTAPGNVALRIGCDVRAPRRTIPDQGRRVGRRTAEDRNRREEPGDSLAVQPVEAEHGRGRSLARPPLADRRRARAADRPVSRANDLEGPIARTSPSVMCELARAISPPSVRCGVAPLWSVR